MAKLARKVNLPPRQIIKVNVLDQPEGLTMKSAIRPTQAALFATLLLASSIFMAFMGMSASGYFVPAVCLFLQAVLLWRGRAFKLFEWVMLLNQLSGLVLILMLWLGDGLGDLKLDIAGAMLLLNLLTGGPLMSLLSIAILGSLRLSKPLPEWFQARA
ncbi:MAG: hypothetical protein Q7J74_16670 [Pseudomonas sp.]|nr:hypothetical protein [Pseudomonas sp.]